MGKAIGLVILLFVTLVVGNILINAGSSFLAALPAIGAQEYSAGSSGGSGVQVIDFNPFSKDGSGNSYMTQGYGRTPYSYLYPGGWHDGIDIAAVYGAPIYSPTDGTVVATGNQDNFCYHKAFGKYVAVRDPAAGLVLWYAHLGTIAVTPGATITKGTVLGTVGATGLETGVHLHFSVFQANDFTMVPRDGCGPEPTGQDLDPLHYLKSL